MDNGTNDGGSPIHRSVASLMRREISAAEAHLILGCAGTSASELRPGSK
jgi:hypothetical protein